MDVLLLEIVLSCNSGVGDKSDLVVTLYGQHPGEIVIHWLHSSTAKTVQRRPEQTLFPFAMEIWILLLN